MLVYQTTNLFIALGKLRELKMEVCTKNKFHSLKNYAIDVFRNTLGKINCSNSEYFDDVNRTYSEIFQKLMTLNDNVSLCKAKRVKGYTQKLV